MTWAQILGAGLLFAVFAVLFVVTALASESWTLAVLVWSLAFLTTAVVVVGSFLLTGEL